jgi:hypothetical protein
MYRKVKKVLLMILFLLLLVTTAHATKYFENFDDIPGWENNWLDSVSNIQNFYGLGHGFGNNPGALWLADGTPFSNLSIDLSWCWSCCITDIEFDIKTWIDGAKFIAYGYSGGILTEVLLPKFEWVHIDLGGLDGMAGFDIVGKFVEGNTSIDNVGITLGENYRCPKVVPEPMSMLLFGAAIVCLSFFRKKLK